MAVSKCTIPMHMMSWSDPKSSHGLQCIKNIRYKKLMNNLTQQHHGSYGNSSAGYGQSNPYGQQGGNPYDQGAGNPYDQQAGNPYAQSGQGGYGGQPGSRPTQNVGAGGYGNFSRFILAIPQLMECSWRQRCGDDTYEWPNRGPRPKRHLKRMPRN